MAGLITLVAVIASILGVAAAAIMLGVAIAGTFTKNKGAQYGVGILIGLGLIFVVAGIIFAGCNAAMRGRGF